MTSGPQGTLLQGYAVEALATAQSKAPLAQGVFLVHLSAFLPSQDMPGQEAGVWHVQGVWTLSTLDATPAHDPSPQAMRRGARTIKGRLQCTLPENPAAAITPLLAELTLPLGQNMGAWSAGTGTFEGDSGFNGLLVLNVTQNAQPRAGQ